MVWPSALTSRSKSGNAVQVAVFGGSVVGFVRNSLFHSKTSGKTERAVQLVDYMVVTLDSTVIKVDSIL